MVITTALNIRWFKTINFIFCLLYHFTSLLSRELRDVQKLILLTACGHAMVLAEREATLFEVLNPAK